MANLVINRFLSDKVFKEFNDELTKLYDVIKNRDLNRCADFWDMQFRKDDTVTLYYKGCALNFKLNAANSSTTYKLSVSDALKEHLNNTMHKDFFSNEYNKPLNNEVVKLSSFFEKHKCSFENAVNHSSNKNLSKERKRQQYITALLEKDIDCFIVDYEVTVESLPEELGKVTFNKECLIKSDNENKVFKELDLLVLKRNINGKYEFIPIEIKMDTNPDYRKAVCQVNAYTRIAKGYLQDFIACFSKVLQQKSEIGILNPIFKNSNTIHFETSINKSLTVVIYDDSIPNGALKVKNLNDILHNCDKACGFEKQVVGAIEVALLKDNHDKNREEIKAKIMGDNK